VSRRIGIAALIWGTSVLLSRVIGVVREGVIGRVLGGGGEADVYWSAFVLPDFLNYLLAGGALTIVFIPIFSRYLTEGDEDGGWRAFSRIANFVVLVLGLATAGLWVAADELVPYIAPGFSQEQLTELARLTRIVLPAQIFHVVGGLLSAVLQAKDRHGEAAFANLGYTGCIVGMGLVFGPTWGAEAFAWGVLIGSILGPFGLPLVGCLRTRLSWMPALSLRDPDFRTYLKMSVPIMLGFSIMVVDDWLLKRYGSLVDEGVVSRLQYAKILMKVPMGVFGLAVGTAAYPTLSRLMAEGRASEGYAMVVRTCRLVLVLALTSQAALTVAGADIAEVIWGTDRFTGAELDEIGLFTGAFCLALGAWASSSIIARGFYADRNTWTPTLIGSVCVLLFWPLYRWLGAEHGGLGLALASSAAVGTYVTVLAWVLRRKMAGPEAPRIGGVVLRMVPAVVLAVVAGRALDSVMAFPALLQGAITGTVALILTLVLARLFGVPEVSEVVSLIATKVRSRLPTRSG